MWSELSAVELRIEDSLQNLKGKAWSRGQAVLVQIATVKAARLTCEF